MSGVRLGFGLLGPLMLTVSDKPVALGTPKQRAVFAMLLINRNRAVAKDSLIDAAWDQSPVPAARTSVHTYVSNLRRLLDDATVDSRAVMISAPPGYLLNVADGDCDLDRFITDKAAGFHAAAAGRFEEASGHLSTALAQWRGPVLDDLRDFGFVETFATALSEDNVLVQTRRAEVEIACGRAYSVIGELESLAAQHPYREPLWAQLITAYYVADRQSDALQAFRRLTSALSNDLGIDPGPTVSALQQRILRHERLDVEQTARAAAARTVSTTHNAFTVETALAGLRDAAGRLYPLRSAATRMGRLPDNDIVLDDADVSRYHAVIVDTGGSFVITDLRSANGVQVQGRPLRPSENPFRRGLNPHLRPRVHLRDRTVSQRPLPQRQPRRRGHP